MIHLVPIYSTQGLTTYKAQLLIHFVVVHSSVIDKINMAFLYGLYPTYCRDGQTFLDYFKSSTNICILHL